MRLAIAKQPLSRVLKWGQRALFCCAALFLGYCGFAVADAWIFQRIENGYFDRLLREKRAAGGTKAQRSSTVANAAPSGATDGLIGRVSIPRLLLSALVAEGIDKTTLRRVVGHIPGTALPGQPGNVGLAGHRDTVFRPLKDLRIKDEIRFSTLNGDYTYVVESLRIVEPNNVAVLAPSSDKMLTLVTCYPFFFVGAAPWRFVVRARQAPAGSIVE
jgi:sortase A